MPYYPVRDPAPSAEAQQQAARKKKRTRLIRLSAAAISCLLIVYGSVRLISYLTELNDSRNTSRELRQINEAERSKADPETPPPAETPEPKPAWTAEEPPEATSTPLVEEAPDIGAVLDLLMPVTYPDNPDTVISDRFKKLRKQGKYIIGWLSFDEVDEAVVQKDNTYFLNHDAK